MGKAYPSGGSCSDWTILSKGPTWIANDSYQGGDMLGPWNCHTAEDYDEVECPYCGTLYRNWVSKCTQCGGSVGYGKNHGTRNPSTNIQDMIQVMAMPRPTKSEKARVFDIDPTSVPSWWKWKIQAGM